MKKKIALFVAAASLALAGAAFSATNLGELFQFSKISPIGTCNKVTEGGTARQLGGVGEGPTKLCICQSDGAAVPVYQWCSITLTGASNVVCAGGSPVVCP
jgi:hypothetical protein